MFFCSATRQMAVRMVLVDYSDSTSSSSGDDSDDDDDSSAEGMPDPPCAASGKRSHAHGGRPRVSPANRAVLREIATSVVVPRALEQRRIVLLPAVVFVCTWRFLVAPLVRSWFGSHPHNKQY